MTPTETDLKTFAAEIDAVVSSARMIFDIKFTLPTFTLPTFTLPALPNIPASTKHSVSLPRQTAETLRRLRLASAKAQLSAELPKDWKGRKR